jgi:hypothetical protein
VQKGRRGRWGDKCACVLDDAEEEEGEEERGRGVPESGAPCIGPSTPSVTLVVLLLRGVGRDA